MTVLYVQLVLGGMFRHKGMGWEPHVLNAITVAVLLTWTAVRTLSDYSQVEALRRPAILMLGLMLAQIGLGFLAFVTKVLEGPLARAAPAGDGVVDGVARCGGRTPARNHRGAGHSELSVSGSSQRGVVAGQGWRQRPHDSARRVIAFRHPRGNRMSTAIQPIQDAGKPASAAAVKDGFSLAARDFCELIKLRVTSLIVMTAWTGFYFGAQKSGVSSLSWTLLSALLGIGLVSGGTAALNEVVERDADALMRRTAHRPLPSGRMGTLRATIIAGAMVLGGAAYLAVTTNVLTGALSLLTALVYLGAYTPLKKVSPICTFVGAFPGAMPPVLGWTAIRGSFDWEALVLFAIVFFWQFPHFLSIAWLYREDYERAQIRMRPVVESNGRTTAREILAYSVALVPVSLLPSLIGMSGGVYLFGALGMSLVLFWVGLRLATLRRPVASPQSKLRARQLLQATVFYLPLLFALMMINLA